MQQIWDQHGEAGAALARAVEGFGPQVLGRADMLSGLLEDDVPHLPREVALLTAAARSGTSARLTERVQQGLAADQAVLMAASDMASRTAMDASGSQWAVGEFARALGYAALPATAAAPVPADTRDASTRLPPATPTVRQATVPPERGPAVPARPVIKPAERWSDDPFTLVDKGRYTIGWQYFPARDGGPCFAVLRRNSLGFLKLVDRYPLTDEGWSGAWRSLMDLDGSAAERARHVLARRALPGGDGPESRRNTEAAGPAQSGARSHVRAEIVPARPVIKPAERWSDNPFTLVDEGRYTIGWQYFPARDGGPCFAVLRRNSLGFLKLVDRYPLTDEGWSGAWRSLMDLDGSAAERARHVLARRALPRGDRPESKRNPAPAAAAPDRLSGAAARASWPTVDELAKLAEMFDKGLITREEFEQLKTAIIKNVKLK